VLHQHLHDPRVGRVAVRRERGEQDVLLDAEVLRAVLVPELQERGARGVGVAGRRTAQALRGDERDVMVARQRLECPVALQTAAFSSSIRA
jgi:hypothetical protein